MQNIKVDFITNTIIVSKGFYEAATDPTTSEYAALKKIKKDYPTMSVFVKKPRRSKGNNSCKGLTYRYMRKFISIMDSDNLVTFESVVLHYEDIHKENAIVYQHVKDWFLKNYPYHKEMIVDAAPQKILKEVA